MTDPQLQTYREIINACIDLAHEFEMGRGPALEAHMCWNEKPCCAFGHVLARAGLSLDDTKIVILNTSALSRALGMTIRRGVPPELPLGIRAALLELGRANDDEADDLKRKQAVIVPLRSVVTAIFAEFPELMEAA